MSSKDEVEETFRGVESESENFYHLELETESKSFIYLESEVILTTPQPCLIPCTKHKNLKLFELNLGQGKRFFKSFCLPIARFTNTKNSENIDWFLSPRAGVKKTTTVYDPTCHENAITKLKIFLIRQHSSFPLI